MVFRTEEVQFKSTSGFLKLVGTALSVGGSMLASFFHGFQLLPDSAIDWRFLGPPSTTQQPRAIGAIMIALSCVAKFGYLVLQRRWFEDFPFPYTSNSIMSVLSSLQCAIVGLLMERTLGSWSLVSPLRIVSVIYS
ncbi:hypothetical protein MKW94_029233, partial [Papaver nudicaule]|nr:hypothetical protein [Papaver nudicaule]